MDFVNLPVFNPNVFSEDEDDLPGASTRVTWFVMSLLLVGCDGDRVVVASQPLWELPKRNLKTAGKDQRGRPLQMDGWQP